MHMDTTSHEPMHTCLACNAPHPYVRATAACHVVSSLTDRTSSSCPYSHTLVASLLVHLQLWRSHHLPRCRTCRYIPYNECRPEQRYMIQHVHETNVGCRRTCFTCYQHSARHAPHALAHIAASASRTHIVIMKFQPEMTDDLTECSIGTEGRHDVGRWAATTGGERTRVCH